MSKIILDVLLAAEVYSWWRHQGSEANEKKEDAIRVVKKLEEALNVFFIPFPLTPIQSFMRLGSRIE